MEASFLKSKNIMESDSVEDEQHIEGVHIDDVADVVQSLPREPLSSVKLHEQRVRLKDGSSKNHHSLVQSN